MNFTAFMAELSPQEHAATLVFSGLLGAAFFELLVRKVVVRLVRSTSTSLDDTLLAILRHPLAGTALLWSMLRAVAVLNPASWLRSLFEGALETALIFVWAQVALRLAHFFLETVARPDGPTNFHIHPRSVPIFDFVVKLGVWALAAYLGLAAWRIDATAAVASFGIVGIAVGFAAQQSLANLFAGVLIIADAPYQLGDMLQLDSGDRGEVVEIGIRSTRLLTSDGVEIIVPNSIMANTKVVNETGGPMRPRRVRMPIGVAYGSDLTHVKKVLTEALSALPEVLTDAPGAPPRVVIKAFAASSIHVEVIVWLAEARELTNFKDAINMAIYNSLHEAGIEIPLPKRDVYLYSSADGRTGTATSAQG